MSPRTIFEMVGPEFVERQCRAAHHGPDAIAGGKQVAYQLLADEAGAAENQNRWLGGEGRAIGRRTRSPR